ncbi:MAG TPA: Flp pilus assembly complex ATPase component TadA, partial [Planctomycetes bacterium]|nr:Flp pilus assembly complex ATPase component TadA [Planctomycetota bacterium]
MMVSSVKKDTRYELRDTDISGLSDLYFPKEDEESHVRDVADVLLEMEKITPETYERLRKQSSARTVETASDTETLLLEAGLCSKDDILIAKAGLCGLEFQHIKPENIQKEAFEKLDIDFIKESAICPVKIDGETLVLATSEPENVFAIEDVKRQTKMKPKIIVCSQKDIEAVCDALADEKFVHGLDDIISDMADVEVVQEQEDDLEDLEKMAGQSPVIKFVNYLISNAIREGASDIHIEPKDKFTKIRCRIDGVLFETTQSSLKMHPAIVSRIKIMANLDIAQRRLP